MRSFYYIRHGQTDWNLADRLQGQIGSVPLNDTGKQQAEVAARVLMGHPFDLIVSSTLDRAAMTAQIIASRVGLPIVYDERLIERSLGTAEGQTMDELRVSQPEAFPKDWGGPAFGILTCTFRGAETQEALADRAASAVSDLLECHADKRLLIVTHGGWLKALLYRLTGDYVRLGNAIPYKASETSEGWELEPLV